MAYEHPLAYLLGIEGLALLRSFGTEQDPRFLPARLAEIRAMLDDPELADAGVPVRHLDTVTGYAAWAPSYDQPGNALFDIEEPVLRGIVDRLAPGDALDAACGTGRHTGYLADLGHRVTGVDSSPEMLHLAAERVPSARFLPGTLQELPLPDASVDLAVCALALAHLPDIGPSIAELARVLRPGGQLVISDVHHEMVLRGSVPPVFVDGQRCRVTSYPHLASDYLGPALANGLQVRGCVEPPRPPPSDAESSGTEPSEPDVPARRGGGWPSGPWQLWPWTLMELVPEATAAANADTPAAVIWHFQRAD